MRTNYPHRTNALRQARRLSSKYDRPHFVYRQPNKTWSVSALPPHLVHVPVTKVG